MQKQTGFTLIELIMVIVILGILAATALPKFVDLSGEAKNAAASGVAGAIASSASIQYASNKISVASYPYVTADACSGNYLEGGASAIPSTCTPTLSGKSCSVACGGAATAVTIP